MVFDRESMRLAIPEQFEIAEALRLDRVGRDPGTEKKQEPESLRKSLEDFIGSVQIVCGYELPNFLNVCDRIRVK